MKKRSRCCFLLLVLAGLMTGCDNGTSKATMAKPDHPATDSADYRFQMGINLNEQVDVADMQDMRDSKTKWIRCFVEVIDLYKAGTLETDAKIAAFNRLKSQGYHTALSLKFNFLKNGFPAKGSTDWNNYLGFINTLLDKVMPYTDVLIVGNEPFIEAAPATWNEPLNSFYKQACDRVHVYFEQKGIRKPVFLGAFDNLYLSGRQSNAGYVNLLAFARGADYLAGVDLHIHHSSQADMAEALRYAAGSIREDQHLLVTEFSLMKYWKSYNNSDIAPAFMAAARTSATDSIFVPPADITKNYQYIDYALKNPRPAQEWYAFWENSPYLAAKSNYLCTARAAFKNTGKVYLSFYALRQSYPLHTDFTADTDPWVLNALFMNRSVQQINGRNQKSYRFLDQFIKIANNENPCQ